MLPDTSAAGSSYQQSGNFFQDSEYQLQDPFLKAVHGQDPLTTPQSDEFWNEFIADIVSSTGAFPQLRDEYPTIATNPLGMNEIDAGLFELPSIMPDPAPQFQQSITPSTSTPLGPNTPDPTPSHDLLPLFQDNFFIRAPAPPDAYPQNLPEGSIPHPTEPLNATEPLTEPEFVVFLTDDARWEAVLNRNALANGHFLYCVKTTTVYCRPTCPSRRPDRSNVLFVFSIADAEELGYRPCKRCKPEESMDPTQKRQLDIIEKLKKELLRRQERGEGKVTVTKIAQDMGVSMWHLNRLFKRFVGTSPKAWAQQQLAQQQGMRDR